MKKEIIILSLLGILLAETALAENAILFVTPPKTEITAGQTLNASLELDAKNNQICVIKGTIVFENLVCQSIQVKEGFVVQTQPTCSNPTFSLGIPKCSIATLQKIATVVAKVGSVGTAKIQLKDTKVIGSGTDVASNINNGLYTVVAIAQNLVQSATSTVATQVQPVVESVAVTPKKQNNAPAVEQKNEQEEKEQIELASEESVVQPAALSVSTRTRNLRTGMSILLLVLAGFAIWALFKHQKQSA